jgi:HK97 family phage major capsid protein
MEKSELELALKTHSDDIKAKQAELRTAIDTQKAELKAEIEALEAKRKEMQTQLDTIATDQAKAAKEGQKSDENMTLGQAVKELMNSDKFKAAKAAKFSKDNVFEIKAATTDITGVVNLTQQRLQVGFIPDRAMAFLPYTNTGVIGAEKSRVLWVEGTYTSNVGYVAQGTGSATADTGVTVEKSRGMAKISAKLPLTAELLEDADYIASAFRMKMQSRAMLFADGEFYTGDGSDGVNPTHIYGIVGQSTAFNAETAGVKNSVKKANIGDLVDACLLQAAKSEQRGLNKVWMNPSNFFLLKKEKDSDGQYLFVKDLNGNYTINGLEVIQSQAVTINTLTVADSSKIQAWWKRNPEIKFSQMNGTDFIDDAYTAVMFLRCQCVIETQDQTAVIHVADITAELVNINVAEN